MNQGAEVIVGAQTSISLLSINMGDLPEYHTIIWCVMGEITKKLIFHGAVLENLDLYSLIKEVIDAHLLTMNIKKSVDDAMTQEISEADKVGSMSVTLTQIITPGVGDCLYPMHHALNMGDQNIGVSQHNLTGL